MGFEASLFASAVDTMIDALLLHVDVDWVEEDAVYQTGIRLFDSLSPSQRISLLHSATTYLLTETDPVSPSNALLDAAVAAVFIEVRDQVAIEVGLYSTLSTSFNSGPTRTQWRERVLKAYQEVLSREDQACDGAAWESDSEEPTLPDEACIDMQQWECLIDELVDGILWDRDFEMADMFLDADPVQSKARRELLGIGEGYFSQIPADPPAYETMRLATLTRDLVRSRPR